MVVLLQRWLREALRSATVRSVVLTASLFLIVSISLYPGLRSIGVLLHAVFTGSYVPGYHSVLLVNFPNEQAARDIGRSVMERRLAASVNILPRTFTMYYWKGEIQDASEILMVHPSLCKPRSPQFPSGGRQSGLHEVDGRRRSRRLIEA
ncbi:protein CutA homolog isoform 2-T2 [Fundulus diaphanus]